MYVKLFIVVAFTIWEQHPAKLELVDDTFTCTSSKGLHHRKEYNVQKDKKTGILGTHYGLNFRRQDN